MVENRKKNTYVSIGPLARLFACSLAPDCSLRSHPPLRSLARSLAHFAHSLAVNDWMAILPVFFSIFDHSAPLPFPSSLSPSLGFNSGGKPLGLESDFRMGGRITPVFPPPPPPPTAYTALPPPDSEEGGLPTLPSRPLPALHGGAEEPRIGT